MWALGAALAAALTACGSTSLSPREEPRSAGGEPGSAGESNSAGESSSAGDAGAPTAPAVGGTGGKAGSSGGDAGRGGSAGAPPTLALSAVTVLQTLEVPLMADGIELGADERPLPLIAEKSSIFRAYVQLEPGFVARPLQGVLDLKVGNATHSLVSQLTLSQSSRADELATTFSFAIEPSDLTAASSYRVRVLEADTTPLVRFPESGYLPLGAQAMQPLEIVLVPFVVGGFSPLSGAAELDALKARLVALFPLTDVELSVAEPVDLDYVVNADGDGWDAALNQIYALRDAAAPPQNVFYFGMMAPSTSYDAYCPNGCILGYSNVADPDDVDSRGAIGVTVFPDGSGTGEAWDTVAHELGHALGRDHAPCGVELADTDPSWPDDMLHRNASLGVYGYDFAKSRLLRPRSYRDVMSYCSPLWISDYTYQGIFERLAHIQGQGFRALGFEAPEPYRLARIGRHGDSSWLGDRIKRGAAAEYDLDLLDAQGRRVSTIVAQVARVDHGPGAFVWLRAATLRDSGAVSVDLTPLGGGRLAL